jgi:F-type H+-transporting ATPase subunit g
MCLPALFRTALPCLQVATCVGFAAELYAWFCIGEIVGRGGSLTGYNV